MTITQAEIKQIRSLREKKFRDAYGLFVVEGEKMVQEALLSDFEVVRVWRRDEIGEAAMARISQLSTPSPVLAVVARPEPAGLALPRRLCLGVETVFASDDCVDLFNPKVIQASMGSVFRVRVVTADLVDIARRFREAGMRVYGTFLDGKNLYQEDLVPEGLILMGNEANGIRPEVAAEADARLLIPSFGRSARETGAGTGAESLNVAAATAITLSEFRRR